jgi:signal transduction histidine kinase
VRRAAPRLAAAAFALWLAGTAAPAAAWICYGDMANEDGPWTERVLRDPLAAARSLQREIAEGRPAAPDPALSPAHRLALLADIQGELGQFDAASRSLAGARAALQPGDGRSLRDRIESHRIMLVEALGDARRAAQQMEAHLATIPDEAPHRLCALVDRGYLRFRIDQTAAAIEDLIQAYEAASTAGRVRWRIYAGNILGAAYSVIGLHEDAWRFGDEAVRHFQGSGRGQELGDAYFRRGNASLNAGELVAAERDLRLAAQLLGDAGAASRLVFVQDRLCQLHVLANRPDEARPVCEGALRAARAGGRRDIENLETGRLGELEVQLGRHASALPLLTHALEARSGAVSQRLRSPMYMARAAARAHLGDWRGAFEDAQERIRLLEEDARSGNAARLAVLNARFQAERRESELQRRQAALQRARAEAAQEKVRVGAAERMRDLVVAGSVLALLALAATTFFWQRQARTEAARRATQERLDALARLSGGVAHEFNNLMTIVLQASGLLRRRSGIDGVPGAVDLLGEIDEAGQTGARITSQMLGFSRQQSVVPEPVHLQSWLAARRPLLARALGEQARLVIDVGSPGAVVRCDPSQLAAALVNLLANARDASRPGAEVHLGVEAHDPGLVRIVVRDAGAGMSPEVLAHAKEPFFSTREVGSGAGLGLSMVHGFALQSGGRLEIESTPGAGTTVSLSLPAFPEK